MFSRVKKSIYNSASKYVLAFALTASCSQVSFAQNSDLDILLQAEEALASAPVSNNSSAGVSISVDGETVLGSPQVQDKIVATDKALSDVDIQVKFDGLDITRRLNVATSDLRKSYRPGENITFVGSWNYPDWIDTAEIRIYRQIDKNSAEASAVPVEVIKMPIEGFGGKASWTSPSRISDLDSEDKKFVYTLRVYDRKGRFDETTPLAIGSSAKDLALDKPSEGRAVKNDTATDRTGVSNIPLYGGSVTVYGEHVPPGYTVKVFGDTIPVDDGQKFVMNRILPPGEHVVDIKVSGQGKDTGLQFERDINIADSEWFYVGLADITFGRRFGDDAELLSKAYPGEFEENYERGRLAMYLKGKVKGETLITAVFDTDNEDLEDIFRNLDEKDPRRLLRDLDPDDFYPVYGDDSTTVDDAPTAGKFYLRVERGESHVMWGNFKSRINETELTRFERGLYGAHAVLKSPKTTSEGHSVAKVEAFAAEPGSLPQRDEFRGTGGSAYFLRRQDINVGSEQVEVELRNRVTGEVVSRTLLRPNQDYEFDHVQGVIILNSPLSSTQGTTGAVRQEAIGGYDQYLIATYEYTPTLTDIEGYTYGGRAQAWLNDNFRVGVTGYREDSGFADQNLYGADILVNLSENSYFELEWAQSEGDTFGYVSSSDGGFIFNSTSAVNNTGEPSQAYRGKISLDLAEMTNGAMEGNIGGYYEHREAGFNAPGRYTTHEERLAGAYADVELSERTKLRARYDDLDREDGTKLREINGEIEHALNDEYTLTLGATHSDLETPNSSHTGTGARTDVGARITRTLDNGDKYWAFGQVTVDRDDTRKRNDRGGVGAEVALTDRLSVSGEVSYGTEGLGGLAALNYSPNKDDKYYLGYRLDPDTTSGDLDSYDPFDDDYGSIVFGANRRLNDQWTAFFEENYDFTGTQRSLTHTYGVNYTPDDAIKFTGGFEAGEIYDEVNGDFERIGVSLGMALREEMQSASVRLEARFEDGILDNTRDRNSYLFSGRYAYNYDDDWRFIANVDGVISNSDQTVILDGDYIEGSLGWAYRAKDNDRLNALLRYTYLEDLPGAQQVNVQDSVLGPRQRSHVFEGDFIYDLTQRFSIGGKYAYRTGQIETVRNSDSFVNSTAHLAVARIDFHVVEKWDVFGEARGLWLDEIDQRKYGYLAGVYRHIGKNLKVGVGYNFGDFSDDVTDLTYDDEGMFINIIGKF